MLRLRHGLILQNFEKRFRPLPHYLDIKGYYSMRVRPTDLAHELDATWIIALWLAIHGGNPRPEVIAAQAVAATAHYVNGTGRPFFGFEQLKAQFGELGVTVTEHTKHEVSSVRAQSQRPDDGEAREFFIHQYCFKFEGSTTCTTIPVLTHLRTAA
ncbi:MAG TPA: hypothetical protein VJP02_10280 [Candidatus Sulfotelmatobacter sp.]|nr:hypothetical protein [Candidatus Sulfotelmatobacter sp.]